MVSIEYDGNRPVRVDTVVISSQHGEDVELGRLQEDIIRDVIKATISEELLVRRRDISHPYWAFCRWRAAGRLRLNRAQDYR